MGPSANGVPLYPARFRSGLSLGLVAASVGRFRDHASFSYSSFSYLIYSSFSTRVTSSMIACSCSYLSMHNISEWGSKQFISEWKSHMERSEFSLVWSASALLLSWVHLGTCVTFKRYFRISYRIISPLGKSHPRLDIFLISLKLSMLLKILLTKYFEDAMLCHRHCCGSTWWLWKVCIILSWDWNYVILEISPCQDAPT
jgi:hypothetical protein